GLLRALPRPDPGDVLLGLPLPPGERPPRDGDIGRTDGRPAARDERARAALRAGGHDGSSRGADRGARRPLWRVGSGGGGGGAAVLPGRARGVDGRVAGGGEAESTRDA